MPQSKSDAASSKADQEYLQRLAQEFSSLPDHRETPTPSSSYQSSGTPTDGTQRNVAIVKTIRTAMSGL
ncbi:unnamed protein product [Clonostachys solani]|uniref:Uncharacterized protein n=1 Tax=Clonostachys solani TaxID=160281 RepID=A0A9N9VZR9_9HYPO|nr:unnamed protein product [Clonostachys solani]